MGRIIQKLGVATFEEFDIYPKIVNWLPFVLVEKYLLVNLFVFREPLIKTALSKESNLILLSETTMSRFSTDFAHSSPCKEVQAVSTTRFV